MNCHISGLLRGSHKRRYWFYRRGGQRIPIVSPDGQRLQQGEPGFLAAYERIHAQISAETWVVEG